MTYLVSGSSDFTAEHSKGVFPAWKAHVCLPMKFVNGRIPKGNLNTIRMNKLYLFSLFHRNYIVGFVYRYAITVR